MVPKPNRLERAASAIRRSLRSLVKDPDQSGIQVEPNEWGHLSVCLGSDHFKGMPDDERHDLVWRHLRVNLSLEDFGELSEVTVLDLDEYKKVLDRERWSSKAAGGAELSPFDSPLSDSGFLG